MTRKIAGDKERLLSLFSPKSEEREIKGFGKVRLRQLSVEETDELRSQNKEGDKDYIFGLRLLVCCLQDTAGNRIFDYDDIPILQAAAGQEVNELVGRALVLNGFAKDPNGKN